MVPGVRSSQGGAMGELLLRKALLARDRMEKLRRALPADPEEVGRDERLEAFLAFHLLLLIQDLVDLAAHVVSARALGVPGTQRELFQLLEKAGLISAEAATAMAAMSSLRNRIAHSYSDLDPVRMAREAPAGLGHAERFLAEVAPALTD
jgi:uncharacterized protein YutE (UPF0331/DUF86 family)